MAISVTVWNANVYALTLIVNRGAQTAVNAVNGTTWAPGTTAAGTGPGWDNGGPSTNNFGPGSNAIQVALGSAPFTSFNMTLPNQPPASVQVYFFFPQSGGIGTLSWFALYGGQVVATGTSQLAAGALEAAGGGSPGQPGHEGHGHHEKK